MSSNESGMHQNFLLWCWTCPRVVECITIFSSSAFSRHEHRREKPCLIDQTNGFQTLQQGCYINVFCRHIGRILNLHDLGQFQALNQCFS